jgi:hypothetical protein
MATATNTIVSRKNFLIGKLPGHDIYIGERSEKTKLLLEKCAAPFAQKEYEATEDHFSKRDPILERFLKSLPAALADLAGDLGYDFMRKAVTHGNRKGFSFNNGNRHLWFPTKGIAKKTRWDLIKKGWSCDQIFLCGALEVIILEQWSSRMVSW